MNEKNNKLGPTSNIKVIRHVENKLSFYFNTRNQECVSIIKVIFGHKNCLIYVIFKGLNIQRV